MSSTLSEIRAAAEPYKSFPKAVAALIRAAFDRGATEVKVELSEERGGRLCLVVSDDGVQLTKAHLLELTSLDQMACRGFPDNIGIGVVHHADTFFVQVSDRIMYAELGEGQVFSHGFQSESITHVEIGFLGLGLGEGVNPRQDRSAKRLVRELPRLLSPREALATTVVDENGKTYSLVKNLHSTTLGGFKIDWPERMVHVVGDGLTLKFGSVRVPMGRFLARSQMVPEERERYNILIHPWLHGVVELCPDPKFVQIVAPSISADDFSDAFYQDGHAVTLGRAYQEIVLAAVFQQLKSSISSTINVYVKSGKFDLAGRRYNLAYATYVQIAEWGGGRVLFRDPHADNDDLTLFLDATHPVFRTISCMHEEVMQVIWWQLAMWIAHHWSVIEKPDARTEAITQIYLALREQNSERSWDDE